MRNRAVIGSADANSRASEDGGSVAVATGTKAKIVFLHIESLAFGKGGFHGYLFVLLFFRFDLAGIISAKVD